MSNKMTTLTVSVVLAREPTEHEWQDFRWRPAEILIGSLDMAAGTVISETNEQVRFFGGCFEIELHRKETAGYLVNLANEPPVVYVVLRDSDDDLDDDEGPKGDAGENGMAYRVASVTVTPFEAQDYLDTGEDIVEPLPMPAPLVAWLERFVKEHHVEEAFIKRRRDRLDLKEEKFGQEPLEALRRRLKH